MSKIRNRDRARNLCRELNNNRKLFECVDCKLAFSSNWHLRVSSPSLTPRRHISVVESCISYAAYDMLPIK